MSKCTVAKQGYPSIHYNKDCQLSHTGVNLMPIMLLAVLFIVAGGALVVAARKRRED